MKKFTVSDNISAEEVQLYRDYVGVPWQKTAELENVSEKIKQIWDKLFLLGEIFSSNALGDDFHVTDSVRTCLDQSGGRAGPKKFRHYLLVRIKHKENEFKDEIYYWLSAGFNRDEGSKIVQKEKFRIRLALGISDQNAPKDLKDTFRKILNDSKLECTVEDIENKTIEEIEKILFLEFKIFKKSFDQIVKENRIELERLKQKREKDEHSKQYQNEVDESDSLEDSCHAALKAENLIFYGPPGTGKTYRLQKLQKEKFSDRCAFVTFHQSYGYEEFVEGLRPILINDEHSDINSSGGKDVKYNIEPGIFKRLCDRARQDTKNGYAIFIDEINRGNISKIFGELITLIELDKRSKPEIPEDQQFHLSLAYSKKPFSVPANVSIIGSMNTADRSLALIDTALRRRFEFKDLYPDTRETKVDNDPFSAPLAGLMVDSIDVRRMLECINERIEVLYDRDHCIGHAYFTGLINKGESTDTGNKFDHFRHIFFNRIKPLLEEYFFDDWEKIGRVLGDHLKKESRLQFLKKLPLPKDLRDFEDNSDDSQIFLRPRYRWNDNAFSDPEAYIGIYSPS